MHLSVFAVPLLIMVATLAEAQTASTGCTRTDVVIADDNESTIEQAAKMLSGIGISSFPHPFREGDDVDRFAREIRQLRPKVLIIHFSIFETITTARPRGLREFITRIEHGSDAVHPQYVVYSASFRQVPTPAEQWITRAGHPFDAIPPNRISTINVSTLKRFRDGNGEDQLRRILSGLIIQGACRAVP